MTDKTTVVAEWMEWHPWKYGRWRSAPNGQGILMARRDELLPAGAVAVLEQLIPYDIEGGLVDGNSQVAIRVGSVKAPWIVGSDFCTAVLDAAAATLEGSDGQGRK